MASPVWRLISPIEADSSSAAAATVWTLDVAWLAVEATATDCSMVADAMVRNCSAWLDRSSAASARKSTAGATRWSAKALLAVRRSDIVPMTPLMRLAYSANSPRSPSSMMRR